ncbi:guanine-N(7)-methyltransferase [Clavulina sp. PMI_390]|nr:guanine-N(7)-methyltransferase [Clavulina sp. PMI_390]
MPPPPPPPSALPQLPFLLLPCASLPTMHIHHIHSIHTVHKISHPPFQPPRKPSIRYAPHNRITPPNPVLIPITAKELHRLAESHRNPLRKSIPAVSAQLDGQPRVNGAAYSIEQQSDGGWSPSRMMEGADDVSSVQQPLAHLIPSPLRGTKRPAADDDAPDYERLAHPSQRPHMSNSPPPPRNHNHNGPRNEVVVAQHYNARPEVGKAAREHSPIIGLKSFNNWIKAVLIAKFARPTIRETNTRPEEVECVGSKKRPRYIARVLDLYSKGGGLGKWAKSDIAGYVGVDIADVSLDQARERWAGQRRKAFDAEFFAMDCYSRPLEDRLPPGALRPPFDVVSQQFCMPYAFESEEKARMMLRNTTMFLRPGGVFIGTTPNAKPLLRKLKKIPEGDELSFGNAVYTIRFESRQPPVDAHGQSTFGHKYWFYLADAVDAPEYLVRWDAFVSLAAEYGLELIYKEDFHTIYEREQEPTEFRQLLTSMKVVDSRGESALDQDQWDAANLYIGFAFKKSLPAPALNGSGASAGNGS